MQIEKQLITKYNTPDTVLVVSTYPRKNHTYDPKAMAVAPVIKNKINAMKKEAISNGKDIKFVVVADDLYGKDAYEEDDHLIIRTWKRNTNSVYLNMQQAINNFPQAKVIHFEHEFGIFGLKNTITAQLPFFFLYNRLLGRRIVMVLHQVIFNLEQLSGHLQINPNSLRIKFLNTLIRANYVVFGLLANKIVVLDAALKSRLSKYVKNDKISAIAHGTRGQKVTYTKAEARKELGLDPDTFYVVFLGYVTWYKGADWLVDAFNKIQDQIDSNKKVELIIAGGESSSMYIDTRYMEFYNKLVNTVNTSPNMQITGVLESEAELDRYARAADLLVMPYRVMMAASGIFAIAQNAESSVLISDNLKPATEATDVQGALHKVGLETNDLLFTYSPHGLLNKINQALTDAEYIKKLSVFSSSLSENRTDAAQAKHYVRLAFPEPKPRLLTRVALAFNKVNFL